MQNTSSPPVKLFIPVAFLLFLIGWGGLAAVILYFPPTVWPRWLFFFLVMLGVTGTALPVMAFLNRRFPATPPASGGVVVREAFWVGVYFASLAWLRIPRVLTAALALLLVIALILIEWLLRLRERSQWKP
jgi:hypothetical protein